MNVSDVDACALPEPHLTLPSAAAALTTGAAILGVALQDTIHRDLYQNVPESDQTALFLLLDEAHLDRRICSQLLEQFGFGLKVSEQIPWRCAWSCVCDWLSYEGLVKGPVDVVSVHHCTIRITVIALVAGATTVAAAAAAADPLATQTIQ
jgi:hypothetical protein